MSRPILIIGGGVAGVSAAIGIRTAGSATPIVIVNEDHEAAYDRPQLSKEYQRAGETPQFRLDTSHVTDTHWIRGVRAEALEPNVKTVRLSNGQVVEYESLIIATGASPRRLPGLDQCDAPVTVLRTIQDAQFIRERLRPGAKLVIIGGGVIGLELAATARTLAMEVTIVEVLPRIMNRCAPLTLASFVAASHIDHGVTLHLGCSVTSAFQTGLLLNNGVAVQADLIVVGIGVIANDSLARAAHIACDDGIFVDGYGRTTCPGVYAVGDVTRQLNPVSGKFERIETWSNAQNQALLAGMALVKTASQPYGDTPWYWSEQYDLRLQVAGLPNGDMEIIRGTIESSAFSIIQLTGGRVVGTACVNQPRDFLALKRMIANRISPDALALRDSKCDLRKIAAKQH